MKKLIYCAAALAAMIFAGSCQQENLEPVAQENTVTYTVEVPTVVTKAVADGKNVDRLFYEVYKTNGADVTDLSGAVLLYKKDIPMVTSTEATSRANVTLNLVQNQYYTVLFWAQCGAEGQGVYDVRDLKAVTYKADSKIESNHENYAAFYAVDFISDSTPRAKKVYLKRPFAQLNIGTKYTIDYANDPYSITMLKSEVTVKQVPTVFNVATSAATEVDDFTFNMDDVLAESLDVNGESYQYVAMNYMFAGENRTAEVTYTVNAEMKNQAGATIDNVELNKTIVNVPLKENYRTNIVGNLLTSSTEYEVIVDADWAGEDLAPDPLYLAASLGGEITLEKNYEFTNPFIVRKDLIIHLNGYNIKGGKDYVAGMSAADISAITIDEGATLTIDGYGCVEGYYAVTVRKGTFNGNGGNYIGKSTGIYVLDGTANLNRGTYKVLMLEEGRYCVVNCRDKDWNRGASKVNITGGTYIDFNPNEGWESSHTVNFLADGYTVIPNVTDNGTEYTVVSGATVATTDEFKAAAQNPALEHIIIASDLDFAGEKVILTTDKIILGNGRNFNAGGGNLYAMSIQGTRVSLQNLKMEGGGGIQLFNGADVKVKDVTIIPAYTTNSRHIFYANNSNLTVESGSFEVKRTKSRYVATEGNSDILIKGGVWGDMVAAGYAPVSIADGGKLSIIGGSFQVNYSTYKFDPTSYLANGYTTKREGDYLVVIPVSE